jgi:hypothetical protein
MRIYNAETDKKANRVTLYLTPDEAKEMKDALEALLGDSKKHHHEHIPDSDFKKEITICIYREDNLSTFDERSKKLILNDE